MTVCVVNFLLKIPHTYVYMVMANPIYQSNKFVIDRPILAPNKTGYSDLNDPLHPAQSAVLDPLGPLS